MLLKCAYKYARTGHSKTKYTMNNFCGFGNLRDTFCRFANVNNDLNIKLSIIITGLLTPNFACNVKEYFKDGGPKSTCQSQNALRGIHSGWLKLYHNP